MLLEVDSEMVVQWLESSEVPRLSLGNLVQQSRRLVYSPWEIKVVHVFREGNRVVDVLASEALSLV